MVESKGRKRSLLTRMEGNFEPLEPYTEDTAGKTRTENEIQKKVEKKSVSKKDSRITLKIPEDIKRDLDVIRIMTKKKYDYETIQWLIDFYVQSLGTTEIRKFNGLKDMFT